MKNKSATMGYVLVVLFLYLAIAKGSSSPEIFLNKHGILIVVGGLFVAALASFPFGVLYDSFKGIYKILVNAEPESTQLARIVVQGAKSFQRGTTQLETDLSEMKKYGFIYHGFNLVVEGIPKATAVDILNKRIEEHRHAVQSRMNVFLTLSKYSPALGLAATVLGLTDLLGGLQSADLIKLGYGMAIALSATFYGIVLSNLVFAPMSELVSTVGESQIKDMEMMTAGIQSMLEKQDPIVVGEIVNSFLSDTQKIDWLKENSESQKAA